VYTNTTAYSATAYNVAGNRIFKLHNSGGTNQFASLLLQVSGDNTASNAVGQIGALQEGAGSAATSLTFGVRTGASAYIEAMRINSSGNVGIGTTIPTAKFDIDSDILRLRTAKTPASAGAAGNAGDICWDADYVYLCIATNTWRRIAHATW
jgi:hypothetical protein